MSSSPEAAACSVERVVHTEVGCSACGCACDDLSVTVQRGVITEVFPPCPLAERALLGHGGGTGQAWVDGQPATYEQAIERATELLAAAEAPLVCGLGESSTEAQRSAVRLAEQTGACIDPFRSLSQAASLLAFQNVGASTATLGELRARSDCVVAWRCDPVVSHPRFVERFLESRGRFVPDGRHGRHLVVIDSEPTATSEMADTFIPLEPGRDIEFLTSLRAAVAGLLPGAARSDAIEDAAVHELAERMKQARYGALLFGDGSAVGPVPHLAVEGLCRLVTELHRHTRWVIQHLAGGTAGAENVLAWQTGFPAAVSFARGWPRYGPGEFSAETLLARGEVDVALVVGSAGVDHLSPAAREALGRMSTIVLEPQTSQSTFAASVRFATGVPGIDHPGMATRMDGVLVPLRRLVSTGLPTSEAILNELSERLGSYGLSGP